MERRHPRRQYFVQRRFQSRVIAVGFAIALLGAVATAWTTGVSARKALDGALFRSHYREQTTREIIGPVLLRVTATGALTVALVQGIAAILLLRQGTRSLGHVSDQLSRWRDQVEGDVAGGSVAVTDALSGAPGKGWTEDMQLAMREAENGLRRSYVSIAQPVLAATDVADQLMATTAGGASRGSMEPQLRAIARHLEVAERSLARYQRG